MKKRQLLWLPGLLCNGALFEPVNTLLPPTIKPFCATIPPETTMCELAKAVLEQASDEFILGGLSMGGILAFEVYRQAPQRVKGLILLDTNAAADRPTMTKERNRLVAMAQQGHFSSITPEHLMPLLIHPDRQNDSGLVELINRMAEDVGIDAFVAHAQALQMRSDSTGMLKDITVPTLVICGKDDQLCPVRNHTTIAEQLPQCSLQIIPHCGHLSALEAAKVVSYSIRCWLRLHGLVV